MPDPQEDEDGDIMAGDRRLSRPDASLPDWEMPDGSYRPIPIVWFTGAFLLQMVALSATFVLLVSKHGAITIALSALISGAIGAWTWNRGMKNAGTGWKVATIAVVAAQLLFFSVAAADRL